MKKIIAFILSLMLLLSCAAIAETDGSWESEGGKLYMDRDSEAETIFSIGEDTIVTEEEGVVFGREPIAEIVLPNPVPASAMSDFDGIWKLSIMDAFGMTIDAVTAQEALGEQLNMENSDLVISNGVVNIFGSSEQSFAFEDGKLILAIPGDEEGSMTQTIELTEDGGIVYTLMGMGLYFAE